MTTANDAEREVEASRSNLDRTVEALKDKMTPGQLFDEAARAMGSGGQQIAAKFMEQARANPMPLAVMGLGLAWLMTSSRSGSHASTGYAEPRSFAPQSGGAGGGILHRAGETAAGVASDLKDRLGGAAEALSDRGHAAADVLRHAPERAHDFADAYGARAQRMFSGVLESEPLILGALGLAVGAAIGAALPHTEAEDHAMGHLRDRLLEKGKDLATQGAEQVGEAARSVVAGAKEQFEQVSSHGQAAEGSGEPAQALSPGASH